MAGAAGSHFIGVSVEYACVVSFSVFCKKFYDFRVNLIAVVLAGFHCHTDTAIGLKGTLEGFISLKAYDGFLFLI